MPAAVVQSCPQGCGTDFVEQARVSIVGQGHEHVYACAKCGTEVRVRLPDIRPAGEATDGPVPGSWSAALP